MAHMRFRWGREENYMYMYIYMYMYTCIYVYIHTHVHMYINIIYFMAKFVSGQYARNGAF